MPLPSTGEVCEHYGFHFQVIIQGDDWYDGYDSKIREWMDEHLTDKFTFYTRFDPDPRGGAVPLRSACIRFRSENDAIAFKMRWV